MPNERKELKSSLAVSERFSFSAEPFLTKINTSYESEVSIKLDRLVDRYTRDGRGIVFSFFPHIRLGLILRWKREIGMEAVVL